MICYLKYSFQNQFSNFWWERRVVLRKVWLSKDKGSRAAEARPKLDHANHATDKVGINRMGVKNGQIKGQAPLTEDRQELDLFRDRNDWRRKRPIDRWCLVLSLIETPGGIDQKAKRGNTRTGCSFHTFSLPPRWNCLRILDASIICERSLGSPDQLCEIDARRRRKARHRPSPSTSRLPENVRQTRCLVEYYRGCQTAAKRLFERLKGTYYRSDTLIIDDLRASIFIKFNVQGFQRH